MVFGPSLSKMKVFPAEPQLNQQSFNISVRSRLCGCRDNLLPGHTLLNARLTLRTRCRFFTPSCVFMTTPERNRRKVFVMKYVITTCRRSHVCT